MRIIFTDGERAEPERRRRSLVEEHRVVVRAGVILDLSAGKTLASISGARGLARRIVRKWGARFEKTRLGGLDDAARSGRPARCPPPSRWSWSSVRANALTTSAVRRRCGRVGNWLGHLSVRVSSAQSVQRVESRRLKPWRVNHWLSSHVPRDEEFYARVRNVRDLYIRPLNPTSGCCPSTKGLTPTAYLQHAHQARAPNIAVRPEHEYVRKAAGTLFAAFDTRTGDVCGILRRRKRQLEFLELLEKIDADRPARIATSHLVCDNVSIHHDTFARAWLAAHPRFSINFTLVHW